MTQSPRNPYIRTASVWRPQTPAAGAVPLTIHKLSPFFSLLLVTIAVFTASACGNLNKVPRYNVSEPLTIEPFKRTPKYQSRDFFFVWDSTVYSPVKAPLKGKLTPSQQEIQERHGRPDYTRRGFRTTSNEIADQWCWVDRRITAQFVQGELVFEGPLTDKDEFLIRRGLPRYATQQQYEVGVNRDIWDYRGRLADQRGMIVTFSNEKLVTQHSY